jgi:hypothetical protein
MMTMQHAFSSERRLVDRTWGSCIVVDGFLLRTSWIEQPSGSAPRIDLLG